MSNPVPWRQPRLSRAHGVPPRRGRRTTALGLYLALLGGPAFGGAAPLTGVERSEIGQALDLGEAVFRLDDAALTTRLLEHAREMAGQRLRPSRIDFRWSLEPSVRDLAAELQVARGAGRLGAWIASLAPDTPGYRALSQARGRYAMMAEIGGWGLLPEGPNLRGGDRGAAVLALRARLAAEGYGAPSADLSLFDADLETAVRDFQAHHALGVDGVVGAATRAALNVTAAERLAQIDANLERWRWIPRTLPADRVEVDTGAQEATLFQEGAPVLRMRAIVGSPKHPTPMFASRIEAVILNPPWNIPASIARTELLPAEARRPGLLASMGIRWVDGHLQQRPGPNNALGVLKFDVANRFSVYLHDTPGKGLFVQPVRAFSHGCMRLEQPRDLALALLAPQGVASVQLDAGLASGVTRRINLQRRLPLYVVHWTVRADAEGALSFSADIYGWDRKLAAALPRPILAQGQRAAGSIRQTRRHV